MRRRLLNLVTLVSLTLCLAGLSLVLVTGVVLLWPLGLSDAIESRMTEFWVVAHTFLGGAACYVTLGRPVVMICTALYLGLRKTSRSGVCSRCGYVSGVCPECGTEQ